MLALGGEARPGTYPAGQAVFGDDLLPSELTALDRRRLVAIVLKRGGATIARAILAAAMEFPC